MELNKKSYKESTITWFVDHRLTKKIYIYILSGPERRSKLWMFSLEIPKYVI